MQENNLFLRGKMQETQVLKVSSLTDHSIRTAFVFLRIPYIFLGLMVVNSISFGQQLLLRGVLLDTVFAGSDSIVAQILENGKTYTVHYGVPFEIGLPPDKTWNLCIRDRTTEQCYTIEQKTAADSIVIDTLQNDNRLSVFTSYTTTISKTPDTATASNSLISQDSVVQQSATQPEIELLTRLRPVIIQVRKRPKRSLGQSTVSSRAIARQPGLAEADVIKAIQALPGVVASSDFSSKIYVRGGGADQNLFLFDNGVVYSPVHFFGLFSTFLVDGIDKVDFYKGGFTPEFGNRLSSVVDITSRKGGRENNDSLTLKGSAQISTFATTVSAEASRGLFRINMSGRSTYIKEVLAGLKAAGVTDLDLDYRFFDLQGNLALDFTPHTFLLSCYTGHDQLLLTPLATDWGNLVIPLNHRWEISDELLYRSTISYSRFEQEFGLENIQSFSNRIESVAFKPVLEYSGFTDQKVRTGIEAQYFRTLFGNKSDFTNLDITEKTNFSLVSLFAEDKLTAGKFDAMPGVRINYITSLHKFSFEPRLSLSYTPEEDARIDLHAGYYKQYINSVIFGDFESVNEFYYPAKKEVTQEVPPSSSVLFSAGYSREKLFGQYEFTGELYYKTLDDLIVFDPASKPDSIVSNPEAGLGDLFIKGEGYSLGAEVSFRKSDGAITGGISYAFGYSVQKEMERVFRAKWEIPHSIKFDGSVNWRDPNGTALWKSKRFFLRSSLQFKFASGLPRTAITGYLPIHLLDQGEGVLTGGPIPSLDGNIATPLGGRNNSRYPPYSRFDIKIVDWGRPDVWDFSWTILNIFNRENVFIYTYDNSVNPPKQNSINQFPLFPVLLAYKRYF